MLKIRRKSLLYKSGVEYADFCLNHVEGCSHGCTFPCYAFQMAKRYGRVKTYSDWLKPKIVENTLDLLDKELPKYKNQIKFVHLCFMTDPFMYKYPEIQQLTLKVIQKLHMYNIRCTVLTKGLYPIALRKTSLYGNHNEYGITLVSLDNSFKKKWEPNSASYIRRINSLRRLSECGLKTWVSMEPYPTPNLVKQDLLSILRKIAFVDKIVFGKLNYNVRTSEFPENKAFYQRCANEVKTFCQSRNIDYHIKFGTQKRDDISTNSLFTKEKDHKISDFIYARNPKRSCTSSCMLTFR